MYVYEAGYKLDPFNNIEPKIKMTRTRILVNTGDIPETSNRGIPLLVYCLYDKLIELKDIEDVVLTASRQGNYFVDVYVRKSNIAPRMNVLELATDYMAEFLMKDKEYKPNKEVLQKVAHICDDVVLTTNKVNPLGKHCLFRGRYSKTLNEFINDSRMIVIVENTCQDDATACNNAITKLFKLSESLKYSEALSSLLDDKTAVKHGFNYYIKI